jgi:hypothetical protein
MTFVKVTTITSAITAYVNLDRVQRIWVQDGGTYLEFRDDENYSDSICVEETPDEIFAQAPK